MARMRSVKPEFWHDQEITRLPRDARLAYIGMWNLADEHARLQGDPRFIKGQLFPYDDDMTPAAIDRLIDELATAGKAVRYMVRGAVYLYLPKLSKHQRLEPDKVASRLPSPEESEGNAVDAHQSAPDTDEGARRADSSALSMLQVAGGMEQGGDAARGADTSRPEMTKRATRLPAEWHPTEADIEWQRSQGVTDLQARRETDKFRDHWTAAAGQNARKLDWSAAWRNWMRRAKEDGRFRGGPPPPANKPPWEA